MARGTKTVSFLLTTYNHEQFVREALRSVFAQVWDEPLDVHISDDCSTDGTWAIVEQEVAAYQGPFRVSAHRNTANMGPMLHMVEAMDRCAGDLLVRGHGDDIQRPERTRRTVQVFRETGASLISSNALRIDDRWRPGELILEPGPSGPVPLAQVAKARWTWHMLGATFSWSKRMLDVFGWFEPALLGSGGDHVLPFRAAMLGGFHYVSDVLLDWRVHDGQVTRRLTGQQSDPRVFANLHNRHNLGPVMQRLRDVRTLAARMPDGKAKLAPLESIVLGTMVDAVDEWVRSDAVLRHAGKRPDWVDKT